MIARIVKKLGPVSARCIVAMPHKLQSPFYKSLYDSMSVPVQKHKRQLRWDDPNYIYPPPTVRPTKKTGKRLISELQQEERTRLMGRKTQIPEVRSGDVLEFGYYRSIAGKRVLHLRGLVAQTWRRNSLNATCKVLMNYHLCEAEMNLKVFSPLLSYLRISKYGAGNLRKKLGHVLDVGTKPTLTKVPILRKNNYAKRIPKDHQKDGTSPVEESETK